MKNKIVSIVLAITLISAIGLSSFALSGCKSDTSSNNEVVGVWKEIDYDRTFYFNDDETAYNVPGEETEFIKYKVLADDSLLIINDKCRHLERTDSKSEALEDNSKYYVSGKTFIMYEEEYTRIS